MTRLNSSMDASLLMEFARFDMTATLPFTYPSDGIILSSEGELKLPPRLSPIASGKPNTGQVAGMSKSSIDRSNGMPFINARALTRLRMIFFKPSPMACALAVYAVRDITFLRVAFSGFSQYCFSYSGRLRPVAFFRALNRLEQRREQKWCSRFLCHASGSDRSTPQSSHENLMSGMCGLLSGRLGILCSLSIPSKALP